MDTIGRAQVHIQATSELYEVDGVDEAAELLRKHALEVLEISDAATVAAKNGWGIKLTNLFTLAVSLTYEGTWSACQDAADALPPNKAVIWQPLTELGTGVIIPGRPHLGLQPDGWIPVIVWNPTSATQTLCDQDEVSATVCEELERIVGWLTDASAPSLADAEEQLAAAREQSLRPFYSFAAPTDQDPNQSFGIHVRPRRDVICEGYASGWASRDAPYTHHTDLMLAAFQEGWDLGAGARDQIAAP